MKFFNVRTKKSEEVDEKDVSFKMTKRGGKMAMAIGKDGTKMVRFVKK